MKTGITSNWRSLSCAFHALLIAITTLCTLPRNAHAQLYVASPSKAVNLVSKFSETRGDPLKIAFIVTVDGPWGLALADDFLFVSNIRNRTVGKYNAITGAVINASFIMTPGTPTGLALDQHDRYLFVATRNLNTETVGEYDATTGAVIDASFIKLYYPLGLAVK
jgi:DNA-binding beta-propeller fold protein YncE